MINIENSPDFLEENKKRLEMEQAMRDFEEDIACWRKLAMDRQNDSSLTETAEELRATLLQEHVAKSAENSDIEPFLENAELRTLFTEYLIKEKTAEKGAEIQKNIDLSEDEIKNAMLDMQINVNRLAAKYYMDHDGDMNGFSVYADNLFGKIDLNSPELKDYFMREATFTRIETTDENDEFISTCAAGADIRASIRDAMLNFYDNNPQLGVSRMDMEMVDIGMFRDGVVRGPDGRMFSYEQLQPYKSSDPFSSQKM